MYHWFFLLKIIVVKIMNNLNVCSAHSHLYPRSRFNPTKKKIVRVISLWTFIPANNLYYFDHVKALRQDTMYKFLFITCTLKFELKKGNNWFLISQINKSKHFYSNFEHALLFLW
jgi:hypothetical protein